DIPCLVFALLDDAPLGALGIYLAITQTSGLLSHHTVGIFGDFLGRLLRIFPEFFEVGALSSFL
ncbi:hypothetical protein, partial [Corynebacterium casei]|uniref:hypothetical protein n=1 Tax=Corynebacterium casei TaxID=160386 RepID=UPI003F969F6A